MSKMARTVVVVWSLLCGAAAVADTIWSVMHPKDVFGTSDRYPG